MTSALVGVCLREETHSYEFGSPPLLLLNRTRKIRFMLLGSPPFSGGFAFILVTLGRVAPRAEPFGCCLFILLSSFPPPKGYRTLAEGLILLGYVHFSCFILPFLAIWDWIGAVPTPLLIGGGWGQAFSVQIVNPQLRIPHLRLRTSPLLSSHYLGNTDISFYHLLSSGYLRDKCRSGNYKQKTATPSFSGITVLDRNICKILLINHTLRDDAMDIYRVICY